MSDHLIPGESINFRPLSWIGEVRQFVNEKGAILQEVIATNVDDQSCGFIPRAARWCASVTIVMQTPQGNMPHQFTFAFGAADVTEAFATWEAEAQKAIPVEIKRLQDEAMKNKLLQGVRQNGRR